VTDDADSGTAMAAALAELVRDLGDALLGADDGLDRFTEPARGRGGPALAVVRPRDVAEVRRAVQWARRHRVHLLPQGAVSGLVGASTPPVDGPPVVVLSTEQLVDGLVVDPVDRTAVVPAGLRLSALECALAPHGLTFPIDLGADPTIGGMVATNTGGARMLRHGDVRRRVLGVQAVVADDAVSVVDDLSTLRKDNTGPDVSGLFVGSAGSLGIVTRVALDLERRPAHSATALVSLSGDEAALDALLVVERVAGERLSALEVLSAPAVDAARSVLDGIDPLGGRPASTTMLVELVGSADVDDALLGVLAALDEGARGSGVEAAVVPPARAWALRHAITEGLRRRGTVLGLDVSVPRPALPTFLAEARAAVAATDGSAEVADFGHWADGGVHCNVVWPDPHQPDPEVVTSCRDAVFAIAVERYRGSWSAEHGVGPHNADWWRRTTPPEVAAAVRGLRSLFDPLRVLGHPDLPW
jgi:FAD/FMN-containing dehydrogenase